MPEKTLKGLRTLGEEAQLEKCLKEVMVTGRWTNRASNRKKEKKREVKE